MEMQASRTLAVSQQQAWEALNDPEVLKLCIPGCDKVEPTGENCVYFWSSSCLRSFITASSARPWRISS